MKRTLFVVLAVCLLVIPTQRVSAINSWTREMRVRQEPSDCRYCVDPTLTKYCIARYDFEPMDWQGWTGFDNTDPGLFWHADNYVGSTLSSAPVPLSGNQSGWCGGGSSAVPITDWKTPSGYANNWDQILGSDDIFFANDENLTLEYMLYVDSEVGNDYMVVELMDVVTGICTIIDGPYSGIAYLTPTVNFTVVAGTYSIRFRFISDYECSDESGCFDSDGGVHIDEIMLTDGTGIIEYENFDTAASGARDVDGDGNGIWWRAATNSFGQYSGLISGLMDKDPCYDNYGTQLIFFNGSIYPSASYPGLFETPFCYSSSCPPDRCQNEMIVSPVIDMTMYSIGCDENQTASIPAADLSILGGTLLEFDVYRDLPVNFLFYYYWKVRDTDSAGNPLGPWQDRGFLYYGGSDNSGYSENDYLASGHNITDMISSDYIQVALGVVDMRDLFFPAYGSGASHTPSPWFDKVQVTRFEAEGPRFFYRSVDLFQDNFADPDVTFAKADAAIDVNPISFPVINPRDCIRITCDSPHGGGIAIDASSNPEVYMHVRALYIGPFGYPNLSGPMLEGDCGHYLSHGPFWTVIQADPCICACPDWYGEDVYEFDLNDSLFSSGYMVEYYFRARDTAGNTSYLPADANTLPDHPMTYYGRSNFFEFTCLPVGKSDILYVDDFHDRLSHNGEVQDNFDDAFVAVLSLADQPDRFDVNGPSSMVSNSLASRATLPNLLENYRIIIWDSGNLRNGTICDGTTGDKSRDCQLLHDWLDNSSLEPCLWVLGDNVAWDLTAHATSFAAGALMTGQCGVQLVRDSYYDHFVLDDETPMVGTTAGSIFNPTLDPFCVYGSCPVINAFDVIEKTVGSSYALQYPASSGTNQYAAINNSFTNFAMAEARTIWFGFSYMYTRGCEAVPQTRFKLVEDAMIYFYQATNPSITGDEDEVPVFRTSLSQNYPNPFNPVTSISYSLRVGGQVTMRIYDVTGRLVNTLIDGTKDAGPHQ
ncbi:MAG: T9SS type A sorting domain-containing protein, partial [Bacteroidales bacterium]|nr:T9SS type A sorting domain-containing protein [Candidatus Latescibacterota bacterium]